MFTIRLRELFFVAFAQKPNLRLLPGKRIDCVSPVFRFLLTNRGRNYPALVLRGHLQLRPATKGAIDRDIHELVANQDCRNGVTCFVNGRGQVIACSRRQDELVLIVG